MAKIKSVSNYNGASWDTPIPLGADDANIDITSATTDPTTDATATAAGLIAADVVAGEGDTGATAWTKFNKFRRRVYNAFSGVAGVSVVTSLVSSGGNSKVYSAGYINNYMTNVVGYSGIVTPTNGTIMDQLNTTNQNLNNRVAKSGDTMTGDLSIDNKNAKITSTQITNNATPSENYYGRGVYFYDTNNVELGAFRPFTGATGMIAGLQGIQLTAVRTINGTKTENYLRLGVDSSGNMAIRTPGSAAAQWRLALGLGTSAGAFPIQINQGGTGNTGIVSIITKTNIIKSTVSGYSVESHACRTWGKIVQLALGIKKSTAGTVANTSVCTVVDNLCPAGTTSLICESSNLFSTANLQNSGELKVSGNFSSNSLIYYFRGLYLLP